MEKIHREVVFLDNSKRCPFCGTDNKSNANFCEHCGKQFGQNNIEVKEQGTIQRNDDEEINKTEGDKLGKISLLLFFVAGPLISFVTYILPSEAGAYLSALDGLCPLSAIVIMIIGRVKYPTNKLLKITMWIFIVIMIISLILLIALMAMCFISCSNMSPGTCG